MEGSSKQQKGIDISIYYKAQEELLNDKMEAKHKVFSVILTVLSAVFTVSCTYAINKPNEVNGILISALTVNLLGIICAVLKLYEKIDHCNQMLRQLYGREKRKYFINKLDVLRAEQRMLFKCSEILTYIFSVLAIVLLFVYVIVKGGNI